MSQPNNSPEPTAQELRDAIKTLERRAIIYRQRLLTENDPTYEREQLQLTEERLAVLDQALAKAEAPVRDLLADKPALLPTHLKDVEIKR